MNKKFLVAGAIATSLLLSACVKKETPAEEEASRVETKTQTQPDAQFENLKPSEPATVVEEPKAAPTAPKVEVIREQSANTTTEIRRETRPAPAEPKPKPQAEAPKAEPKPQPKPQVEAPKAEPKPQQVTQPKVESTPKTEAPAPRSNSNQSQDDAVAAAIAAATPALD